MQKAGHQGDSSHHVCGESYVETWCWGWFIKLDHPSIFHGSFDGQRKLLEGAEENQVVPEIVWARFVPPPRFVPPYPSNRPHMPVITKQSEYIQSTYLFVLVCTSLYSVCR
jgi:hypothetical protein